MLLLGQFFLWMPNPIRYVVNGVIIVFLIWVITGIIKRVLDVIPFA